MKTFMEEALPLLKGKIAILEGQPDTGEWEDSFIAFLKGQKIKHKVLVDLYKKKKDLSKYDILCFATTMIYAEKVERLMDFDTSNLKAVVVLNETAFDLSYWKAKELGIPLIGFDWGIWRYKDYEWAQEDMKELLFDPIKRWRY